MPNQTAECRGVGEGRREAMTLMKETVTEAGDEEKVMHDAHVHHMHAPRSPLR